MNVYRGAADQNPRVVRRVAAGKTGVVHAGEWVIERPRVVHFGANRGGRPVMILLATLFRNGSPPSIPVPGWRRRGDTCWRTSGSSPELAGEGPVLRREHEHDHRHGPGVDAHGTAAVLRLPLWTKAMASRVRTASRSSAALDGVAARAESRRSSRALHSLPRDVMWVDGAARCGSARPCSRHQRVSPVSSGFPPSALSPGP
jgi:hypothetical protein